MQQLAQICKVMSDINRIKIVALILRETEVCVCEVCNTLKLSQPLVSRHLRQMREAGILNATKKRQWMVYSLNDNSESVFKCFTDNLIKEIDKLPKLIACDSLKKYQ